MAAQDFYTDLQELVEPARLCKPGVWTRDGDFCPIGQLALRRNIVPLDLIQEATLYRSKHELVCAAIAAHYGIDIDDVQQIIDLYDAYEETYQGWSSVTTFLKTGAGDE